MVAETRPRYYGMDLDDRGRTHDTMVRILVGEPPC